MIKHLKTIIHSLVQLSDNSLLICQKLDETNKLLSELAGNQRIANAVNPFAQRYSKRGLSQEDEDGIIAEIINRVIGESPKLLVELGVGNGLENNTLVYALSGDKVLWISGQEIQFQIPANVSHRFKFMQKWITRENISSLLTEGITSLQGMNPGASVLSVDLDGNDYYILREILSKSVLKPDIIIAEYNAAFGSYIKWKQTYSPAHQWQRNQYFGASFACLADLGHEFNYFVVACNPRTGANMFLVHDKYRQLFPEVPKLHSDIFEDGFYKVGHNFLHTINSEFVTNSLSTLETEECKS